MKSRVTTGKGDEGLSRALDGSLYSKAHPIMECTGNVDELRAQTALLRQVILRDMPRDYDAIAQFLLWVLHTYFLIGTECSDPARTKPEYRAVALTDKHRSKLETEQARLESQINFAKAFIAGASNVAAAEADRTSAVARRLERSLVRLKEAVPAFECSEILVFVNRLSDYFFVLARALEDGVHMNVDYTILDT